MTTSCPVLLQRANRSSLSTMFSTLRRRYASENTTNIPQPNPVKNKCVIEEAWSTLEKSDNGTPYSGLVVYALDVSGSMGDIKTCLSKSLAAIIKTMKVLCPGVAQTVVTYSDFDITDGPIIRSPLMLDCGDDEISKYLDRTQVKGGGHLGCEAFDVALTYILEELVPAFHRIQDCATLTPVQIFNLTDEDIRLSDSRGKYGSVYGVSVDDYTCCEDQEAERGRSADFFKSRWNKKPRTASEFKNMLIARNCWLRCLSYSYYNVIPRGYGQLCKWDSVFNVENERWQLFMFPRKECEYEHILSFLAKHQWCFFNNLPPSLSASGIAPKLCSQDIENLAERKSGAIRPEWDATQAQIDDLFFRIDVPTEISMHRLDSNNKLSSKPYLLINAFDRSLSLPPFRSEQQNCAEYMAKTYNSVGNVASCMAALVKDASAGLTVDDIAKSEFGHCTCKKCEELLQNVKSGKLDKGYYIKTQMGRYLAKALFEPMIGDKAMLCACAALSQVTGSIYSCVSQWAPKCAEANGILTKLKVHDVSRETKETSTSISESSRKRAYDAIKSKRSDKTLHYDSAHAVAHMLSAKCDEEDVVWVYLKNQKDVCSRVKKLIQAKNITPELFKRFEQPECFEVMQILATNVAVTRSVEEVPELPLSVPSYFSSTTTVQMQAIPVSLNAEDPDEKRKIIAFRAAKYFDGDENVAAFTVVPASCALQTLPALFDTKYGLNVYGYSGIKSVAAAVTANFGTSLAGSTFAGIGRQALASFVKEKRGTVDGLSLGKMFLAMLGDGIEGSMADSLSNSITLNHINTWSKKYKDEIPEELSKLIEHFVTVRYMAKMEKNCISSSGFKEFAVRELEFDEDLLFECGKCGLSTLKKERFGNSCVRCIESAPEQTERFIRESGVGAVYEDAHKAINKASRFKASLPLKYTSWKLTTADDERDSEFSKWVQRLRSKNKKIRTKAAVNIVEKRLNAEKPCNVTVALDALKASGIFPKGTSAMLYTLMSKNIVELPAFVAVKCSVCECVYKASLLAPSKKQNRICPWCRASKKVRGSGKTGVELLNYLKTQPSSKLLWLIDNCLWGTTKTDDDILTPEEMANIDSFFERMRQNSTQKTKKSVSDLWQLGTPTNTISVSGFGQVKQKSRVYEGGEPCTLQQKISWEKFNTKVACDLLGYRLDGRWSKWNDFLTATQADLWEFVYKSVCHGKTAAAGELLEKLKQQVNVWTQDFIHPDLIASFLHNVIV